MRNISLRFKLYFATFFVSVMLLGVGLYSMMNMKSVTKISSFAMNVVFNKYQSVTEIEKLSNQTLSQMNHLARPDVSGNQYKQVIEKVDSHVTQIQKYFDGFSGQHWLTGEKEKFEKVQRHWGEYKSTLKKYSDLSSTGGAKSAAEVGQLLTSEMPKIQEVYFDSLADLGLQYVNEMKESTTRSDQVAAKSDFWMIVIIILGFIMNAAMGYGVSLYLIKTLGGLADTMRIGISGVSKVSGGMSDSSHSLAAIVNEQSAAMQETVASMSEMSSMISQTNQNAQDSLNVSESVKEKTDHGLRIMQSMVTSMESIQQANSQLVNMANIIDEISAKTMVINDIVFKTQLLSFNASIEAARAGVHGKGFSVVAEEVGNLAQLSGTASKEIQSLIQDSQKTTNSIIVSTQERVSEGQAVSNEALDSFNQIAKEVEVIATTMKSIADATREQEAGVKQATIAMNQMDETTMKTNSMSQQSLKWAQELSGQGKRLKHVMFEMRTFIFGEKEALKTAKSPSQVTKTKPLGADQAEMEANLEKVA